MTGKVRWYSRQGFGFIDPLNSPDGKALYFHISDVKDGAILKPGDVVTFDTRPDKKGPRCIRVQLVSATTKEVFSCPHPATA